MAAINNHNVKWNHHLKTSHIFHIDFT